MQIGKQLEMDRKCHFWITQQSDGHVWRQRWNVKKKRLQD